MSAEELIYPKIFYTGIGSKSPYIYSEQGFRILLKLNEDKFYDPIPYEPLKEYIGNLLEWSGDYYIVN